ncbi:MULTISPECIES: ABC transporter permease [Paenibacillus]|uniref:ABC transporter permease n=1 Tax=Paenibacillus TaxID=44249 RepID=UPI0006D21F4B|nr:MULTISPECIES: ABC transporter permease [Paenibacillus]NTZ17991.1 ABC transporter permease [Paenibacillus sp. JMULE4]GCL73169.1 ABC transporter permease [Paenibacillus naphthalenovorans]SDJ88628.1 NitT/TauT family transport system permease protein [Paenibacillus naphthalenovorans]
MNSIKIRESASESYGSMKPPDRNTRSEAQDNRKVGPGKRKRSDGFLLNHIGAMTVVVVLAVWEMLYRSGVINPIFLSSPIRIIKVGYQLTQSGVLLDNLLFTLGNFFVGFGLAAVLGIFVGLLMGWYRPLGKALDPFLTAMLGTPRIVLLPLITLWVGVGFSSKVLVVFIAGVFPIILNTMTGVRNLDPNLTRVAGCFGASAIQTFITVALPGSLPQIVSGLRVGIGQSLVGVIAAEMFVSTGGIGYFVAQSSANFNIDRVFVGIIVIVMMGMAITSSVKLLETRLLKHRMD